MELRVTDPRPGKMPIAGPAAASLLGVSSLTTGQWIGLVFLAGGALWFWVRRQRHQQEAASGERWLTALNQHVERFGRPGAELPVVDSPIPLRAGESCHWVGEVEWIEARVTTSRVDYSGASLSVPVAKGVRFRLGSIAPKRVTARELQVVDTGRLVITNKRLFFDGRAKNTTIEMRHLVGVGIDGASLLLDKTSGRDPRLRVLEGDSPLAAAVIVARILTDLEPA